MHRSCVQEQADADAEMSESNELEVSDNVEDIKIKPFEPLIDDVFASQIENYLHTDQPNTNNDMST